MAENYHIHGVLDFAVTAIRKPNLNFEYDIIKSWWYSNSSIIDWCQTLSNEIFYSFFLIIFFMFLSILNNSFFFEKISKLKKFFIPIKIIFESILIYYSLKISVLFIVYPMGGIILLLSSNLLQFISLILFLITYLIIMFAITLFIMIILNNIFIKRL